MNLLDVAIFIKNIFFPLFLSEVFNFKILEQKVRPQLDKQSIRLYEAESFVQIFYRKILIVSSPEKHNVARLKLIRRILKLHKSDISVFALVEHILVDLPFYPEFSLGHRFRHFELSLLVEVDEGALGLTESLEIVFYLLKF